MKSKYVSSSVAVSVMLAVFLVSSCNNDPPNCSLIRPSESSCYFNGDTILIKADAFDGDGNIVTVEISLDGELIAALVAPPYEYGYVVKDFAPGDHELTAVATDDKGESVSDVTEIRGLPDPGEFQDPRDGNTYRYVTIGKQTWMIDNLAYLPSVSPSSESSESTLLYYVLGYEGSDVAMAKSQENYSLYGALYNWEAAKQCCPGGWHLPTDEEWVVLESTINTEHGPFNQTVYPVLSAWWGMGEHIWHTSGWAENKNGLNTYGFSALPAGAVAFGEFPEECGACLNPHGKVSTIWWSATQLGEFVITRHVWSEYAGNMARSIDYPATYGLSVRCLKDN